MGRSGISAVWFKVGLEIIKLKHFPYRSAESVLATYTSSNFKSCLFQGIYPPPFLKKNLPNLIQKLMFYLLILLAWELIWFANYERL